ncbi:hypothetical protein RS130_04080 [Paraglaciecola aquimarina]|uniref:Uncharacterized protein n=1 Tax=Paraglaciecola aquimarina TaxID=1235557 RepID=A0ABU3STC1_9ALTE|nr:hypothetical protein [Paraglaciecola aquimarina]MDU0353217.1 hypothetical protein [Paraglaciecola aquimarina]
MKGSTGDIGATELHGLYSQIEMQAKQQNLEQIVGLFEQTQTSYENFCISLQEFIDEEQS